MAGVRTDYIYSGYQCVEERDESDNVTRQYVWGLYVDELIQQRDNPDNSSAADYYPLQDLLYRTAALTDDGGNVVEAYDTNAYGRTLIFDSPGSDSTWFTDYDTTTDTPTCEFIFTGRRYDPESRLYHYRARAYNPNLGRFLQRDPLMYIDGMSMYEYVMSTPQSHIDPFGLGVTVTYERCLTKEECEQVKRKAAATIRNYDTVWDYRYRHDAERWNEITDWSSREKQKVKDAEDKYKQLAKDLIDAEGRMARGERVTDKGPDKLKDAAMGELNPLPMYLTDYLRIPSRITITWTILQILKPVGDFEIARTSLLKTTEYLYRRYDDLLSAHNEAISLRSAYEKELKRREETYANQNKYMEKNLNDYEKTYQKLKDEWDRSKCSKKTRSEFPRWKYLNF